MAAGGQARLFLFLCLTFSYGTPASFEQSAAIGSASLPPATSTTKSGRIPFDAETAPPGGTPFAAAGSIPSSFVTSSCEGAARYRVDFYAEWSEGRFPKRYPVWRPPAQWSKLIGSTHSDVYTLWRRGQTVTDEFKDFAQDGDANALQQLLAQGQHGVFDVFQMPAIETGVGNSTFSVVVDSEHSLLSLALRIIPSPDWFVGVDSVNLCSSEGHWLDFVSEDLAPMDGGTDRGLTFTAPNWASVPQQPVKEITSQWPKNSAGAFRYKNLKKLPRIGQVVVSKVRDYSRESGEVRYKINTVPIWRILHDNIDYYDDEYEDSEDGTTQIESDEAEVEGKDEADEEGKDEAEGEAKDEAEEEAKDEAEEERKDEAEVEEKHEAEEEDKAEQEVKQGEEGKYAAEEGKSVVENELTVNDKNTEDAASEKPREDEGPEIEVKTKEVRQVKAEGGKVFGNREEASMGEENSSTEKSHEETQKDEGKAIEAKNDSAEETGKKEDKRKKKLERQKKRQKGRRRTRRRKQRRNPENDLVPCEVTEWSGWTKCSKTCGFGTKERQRKVSDTLMFVTNMAPCPELMENKLCGSMRTCKWSYFKWID